MEYIQAINTCKLYLIIPELKLCLNVQPDVFKKYLSSIWNWRFTLAFWMKKSVRVFYIPVWFLIKNMAAEEKKKRFVNSKENVCREFNHVVNFQLLKKDCFKLISLFTACLFVITVKSVAELEWLIEWLRLATLGAYGRTEFWMKWGDRDTGKIFY